MPVDTPAEPRRWQVRDGSRVLHFDGWLVARGDSRRPGSARWSEVSVHRLLDGAYVVALTGWSTVTHLPDCRRVHPDMPDWASAGLEDRSIPRSACAECRPDLTRMSPHLRVERNRHRASVVPDASAVVDVLTTSTLLPAALVNRVLDQAADADRDIAKSWT